MKQLGTILAVILWTLICVYSTYWNTVEHAEMTAISKTHYEITYGNTGEVYVYTRK